MAGQAHHRGRRYVVEGGKVVALANANPRAVCCHCGLTLGEHAPHASGAPATWTRGHTSRGSRTWEPWFNVTSVPPAGDWLAPAASTCNYLDGAAIGGRERERHTVRF